MSQSNIQVLLHQGELLHIVEAIQKSNGKFVGGCLFGLWRNSLKQPVIQFVTCRQGYQERSVDAIFDRNNNSNFKKILFEDHAMLNLGCWFSGSPQEKEAAYDIFSHSSDKLLLFISFTSEKLDGQFYLKTDDIQEHGSLCSEDVLPGQSSFRLDEPLTTKIRKAGGMVLDPTEVDKRFNRLLPCIQALPSRIEVRDPETKEEQWYSTKDGEALLQKMVASFKTRASIEVEMSRDATTHNIQFNLNGGYCLDFPPDFPKQMPRLSDPRGQPMRTDYDYQARSSDYGVVDAVYRQLQYNSGYRR